MSSHLAHGPIAEFPSFAACHLTKERRIAEDRAQGWLSLSNDIYYYV